MDESDKEFNAKDYLHLTDSLLRVNVKHEQAYQTLASAALGFIGADYLDAKIKQGVPDRLNYIYVSKSKDRLSVQDRQLLLSDGMITYLSNYLIQSAHSQVKHLAFRRDEFGDGQLVLEYSHRGRKWQYEDGEIKWDDSVKVSDDMCWVSDLIKKPDEPYWTVNEREIKLFVGRVNDCGDDADSGDDNTTSAPTTVNAQYFYDFVNRWVGSNIKASPQSAISFSNLRRRLLDGWAHSVSSRGYIVDDNSWDDDGIRFLIKDKFPYMEGTTKLKHIDFARAPGDIELVLLPPYNPDDDFDNYVKELNDDYKANKELSTLADLAITN